MLRGRRTPGPWGIVSYALYLRFKVNLPEFEELAAIQAGLTAMSVRGESEWVAKPLPTEFVTGNYFSIFGIRPFAGRLLSVARCSSPPVAVLSCIGGGKLIASELYGVRNWDPPALAVAVISLGLCALLAAMIPALRAAGISPTDALRSK